MAIRKFPNRPKPYGVYWRNPFTSKQESAYFATKLEAEKHNSLVRHRLKYEKESFRPEDTEEEPEAGSVAAILGLYLQARKFSPTSLKMTLYHLKTVLAFFGRMRIEELERKAVSVYLAKQSASGVSPLTSHRRLSILRAALSWAEESSLIERNPLAGLKVSKGKPERIAPPTPTELGNILSVSPPHLQRAIFLSFYLGVRVGPSELLSLKWEDVDIARGVIRVWSAKKNLHMPYRDLPIHSDLLSMMKQWQLLDGRGEGVIVHYGHKPVMSIKSAWKSAKEKAGIVRRLRPYDLRHAFATFALDAGADIKAVAEMMNHSDPSMILRHYQHTKEATKRNIVESLPCMSSVVCLKKESQGNLP